MSKPNLSPADAVLVLVQQHREVAASMERFDPDAARVLRQTAAEYETAVVEAVPDWIHIRNVQTRTGWSRDWLRAKAAELAAEGLAKKKAGRGGGWLFRRSAAYSLPVKPSHAAALEIPRPTLDSLRDQARRLAS